MRLVFAVLVIVSHSFPLYAGVVDPVHRYIGYGLGEISVLGFFIISGYLITMSFERSASLFDYLKRRVARICPGYLVAVRVISFVLLPLLSGLAILTPVSVTKAVVGGLLLRATFPPSDAFAANPYPDAVNGSLWSIPYEFRCYLILAVLGVTGLLARRGLVLGLTVAALVTRGMFDLFEYRPFVRSLDDIAGNPYFWSSVFPAFTIGACVHLYRDRLPRGPGLATIAGALLLALALPIPDVVKRSIAVPVLIPCLAYLVFHLAYAPKILPAVTRYGDFSYGTYLYAFTIQQTLVSLLGKSLPFGAYVAVSVILSLAAGIVSWFLVERWFLRRARARAPERSIALPASAFSFVPSSDLPDDPGVRAVERVRTGKAEEVQK